LKYEKIKDYRSLYGAVAEKINGPDKTYIFIDEVQEVWEWERAVNSLMIDFDVDLYVTGSNSRMLSSEISTYLTGRYVSINVYTLSFSEYLDFKNLREADRSEFLNYLKTGGFPAVATGNYVDSAAYTIVRDVYNSIILKDIVERNGIRNVELLQRIVKFIFENIGKTFSSKSVADYLKSQRRSGGDAETVYNYIDLLERAFIIYRAPRYDLRGKEIMKTQEKYYAADPSLRYAVLGFNASSVAAMLENIVYLELRRRGYEAYVGKIGEFEIDFVAIKGGEKIYVQVAKELNLLNLSREYGNLLKIEDNFPKYLLTMGEIPEGTIEGIKIMRIEDFLCDIRQYRSLPEEIRP